MASSVVHLTENINTSEQKKIEMIDFYNEATEDYQFWSNDYNMHFGYYALLKTNPFKRDSMLNEMNHQVLNRLQLPYTNALLADLGCGMGGTMRYAFNRYNKLHAFGVTLSNFQVTHGNALLKNKRGIILKENYMSTSFTSGKFDGVTAIESFCHSGHNKKAFEEAFRILKPNGKLVIADAFLKKEAQELCYGGKYAYNQLCNHWSLEKLGNIHEVEKQLKAIGFSSVTIEDASFRVAPSVLHVPFAIIAFTLKKWFASGHLKKESYHNLKGSFYALLSGLHMRSFGYYIITCTK